MTVLTNCPKFAVIVESNGKTEKYIMGILKKSSIKNIAVIDMKCMNTQFPRIHDLMNDSIRLKVFHGGNIRIFNNMIESFGIDPVKRRDIVYVQSLDREEIVRSYWNYYFKKFPPTILQSARGGSFNEEV